jgi:hypothetical protein
MRLPNLAVGGSISWTSSPGMPGLAPARRGLGGPDIHVETCAGQVCVPGSLGCPFPCNCLCSIHLLKDEESGQAHLASTGCRCQAGAH